MSSPVLRLQGKPISHELIATISRLLVGCNIPAVLWGDSLLSTYNIPVVVEDISFVVPDEAIPEATHLLHHARFRPCSLGKECYHSHERANRWSPPAAEHFHWNDPNVLLLFRKSEIFSKLANLSIDPESASNPRIIFGSNRKYVPEHEPGSGIGAFPPNLYPVRVPSAPCLVEAYASQFLSLKDRRYFGYWQVQLSYVGSYIDKKGRLDLQKVEDRSRKFYQGLFTRGIGMKKAVENFRGAMGEPAEFPFE